MKLIYGIFLFVSTFALFALDPMAYKDSFPVEYIGITLEEAWHALEAPQSIQLVHGDNDNVIPALIYHSGLVLYILEDRVWQLSLQAPWDKPIWGIRLGDSFDQVKESLEHPFLETPDMLLYKMPDIGFPVEARYFFDETGTLLEFHFYRSDY